MPLTQTQAQALALSYTDAWNQGSAQAVAAHYAESAEMVINSGPQHLGRAGVREVAEGFFADVPDLHLICDGVRLAGDHLIYLWTFTGHHARTVAPLSISGWEEWDLGPDRLIRRSRGWYDTGDYARQVNGS